MITDVELERIVEKIYFVVCDHLADGTDSDDAEEIKAAIREGLKEVAAK